MDTYARDNMSALIADQLIRYKSSYAVYWAERWVAKSDIWNFFGITRG